MPLRVTHPLRRLLPACAVFVAVLVSLPTDLWAAPTEAQQREAEQVQPGVEGYLRRHLMKLEGWGIKALMRTEQQVDREQKRRANLSTNAIELAELAEDEDLGVRFYVAANSHASLGTRLVLARDPVAVVRSGVAMSLRYDPLASKQIRTLTTSLAADLARDGNILVRMALVRQAALPPETWTILAQDEDRVIRQLVAGHPDAPTETLTVLAGDTELLVRSTALSHRHADTDLLARMAQSGGPPERLALCANPNTPVGILDALAMDTNPLVRRGAAAHPNTRLPTLRQMAGDSDVGVVQAVASHPHADRDLLMLLAFDDRDAQVRLTAQDRLEPLLRREIRDDILERWEAN
ncbi:MAG: hypothetical protein HOH74_04715 [Gemmatimonadetes bacterium]|nr:hypothetical protein [Gemmatimonadota bacterium]